MTDPKVSPVSALVQRLEQQAAQLRDTAEFLRCCRGTEPASHFESHAIECERAAKLLESVAALRGGGLDRPGAPPIAPKSPAEAFLRQLRKSDSIVSTDGLDRVEIAAASACGRLLAIGSPMGLGYVLRRGAARSAPPVIAEDVVCAHGTALDVHCCGDGGMVYPGCHSGFVFDLDACQCRLTSPQDTVAALEQEASNCAHNAIAGGYSGSIEGLMIWCHLMRAAAARIVELEGAAALCGGESQQEELENLKADASWRHRWHARLWRGEAETEGKFYKRIESELAALRGGGSSPTGTTRERINTRCPSCGHSTLDIGNGGWLVCTLIGCKDPTLINRLGEAALSAPSSPPPIKVGNLRREGREDVLARLSVDLASEIRANLDEVLPLLSDEECDRDRLSAPSSQAVLIEHDAAMKMIAGQLRSTGDPYEQ